MDVQKTMEFILEHQAQHAVEISELRGLVKDIAVSINSLSRIAEIHEHRLSRLEGDPS